MRTKGEILSRADEAVIDIRKRSMLEAYYMRLGLEVFIDLRNILEHRLLEIDRDLDKILDALKK